MKVHFGKENSVVPGKISKNTLGPLLLFGVFSALLFVGCAHKSVPASHPPSRDPISAQNRQILLANAGQITLNPRFAENTRKDSMNREFDQFEDEFNEDNGRMSDPLILWNRAMFHFNDK